MQPTPASPRLASVDVLRGLTVAGMLLVNNPGSWAHVYAPLRHAPWHGFTVTDLVFPMFLFIVGVGIAVGGREPKALSRGAKLFALGLLLATTAYFLLDRPAFRPLGVLQRIGLCFAIAAPLAWRTSARTQWVAIGALLLGYAALLHFGGTLEKDGNIASRVDSWLLGRHAYEFDPLTGKGHEPEGLLSTLPAIATTLLGVRAGAWLKAGQLRSLLVFSAVSLAAGIAWNLWQPLNKNLWTSSYVLYTAGLSALALWAAHLAIDRRGLPALGRRFGYHAIAAYVAAGLFNHVLIGLGGKKWLVANVFKPLEGPLGAEGASLAFALAFVTLFWFFVYALDKSGRRFSV